MLVALALGVARTAPAQGGDGSAEDARDELKILSGILTRQGATLETRRDAASLLLKKGTAEATAILSSALEKNDPVEMPLAILLAVGSSINPPRPLLPALYKRTKAQGLSPKMREALGGALSAYRSAEALKELLDRLGKSEAVGEKLILIGALGRIGEKEAVPPLIELLQSDSETIRHAAAAALSAITQAYLGQSHDTWVQWWKAHENEPRGKWLFERLRAQESQLQKQAAALDELARRLVEIHQQNLQKADPGRRLREVVRLLDDSLPALRRLAAGQARKLLKESKEPQTALVDKLLARATDQSPLVREEVAAALAAAKDKRATDLLVARLIEETSPAVREAVVKALGELREGRAVEELVKLLGGSDQSLMLRAIESLGQIGERGTASAEAIGPALEPLANLISRNGKGPAGAEAREAAVRTLSRIGREKSLPALVKALDDSEAKVRFFAAQGVGNIGKDDARVVEALLNHLSDADKGVRTAVAHSLGKIGNSQAGSVIAGRLGPGGEIEKEVRQALFSALLTIQRRSGNPKTIERLADEFAAHGDPGSLKGAVQLYEAAIGKLGGGNGNTRLIRLKGKLAETSIRAGLANKAVTILRELVEGAKDDESRRPLERKLGRVLITIPPYIEGLEILLKAISAAPPEQRGALLQAIHDQARLLKDSGKSAEAWAIIARARKTLGPKWAGSDQAPSMETLYLSAGRALFDRALQALASEDAEVRKRAEDQARQVAAAQAGLLLARLAEALSAGDPDDKGQVELLERILPALGNDLTDYRAARSAAAKLAIVKAWQRAGGDSGDSKD